MLYQRVVELPTNYGIGKMINSGGNKGQKLVGHFLKIGQFCMLLIAVSSMWGCVYFKKKNINIRCTQDQLNMRLPEYKQY